jgi:hypothetical protein
MVPEAELPHDTVIKFEFTEPLIVPPTADQVYTSPGTKTTE